MILRQPCNACQSIDTFDCGRKAGHFHTRIGTAAEVLRS